MQVNTRAIETYNVPFSTVEFASDIKATKCSAQDPVDMNNAMLKHLPSGELNTLLNVYNKIWQQGYVN